MALLQTDCMLTCNIIFFSNLLSEHSSKSILKYLLEKLLDKWYSCYLHQLKNILPLFTIFLILHIENKEKNTVTMVNYHYTALPPSHLPRNLRILLFNTNWKEVHCRKAGRNPKCSFKTGKKKNCSIYIYIYFAIYPPQVKRLTCSLTFHVFNEVTFNALFKLLQDLYAITANIVHRERCRSM